VYISVPPFIAYDAVSEYDDEIIYNDKSALDADIAYEELNANEDVPSKYEAV
jgi:hypothetical protein